MIKLDDGRVWKRHVEQIHRVGEGIPEPPVDFQFEPSNEFIISRYSHASSSHSNAHTHTQTPPNTSHTSTPNTPTTPYHTAPNTPESTSQPIATGSPISISESRPQRQRVQPQRLQYDQHFNQV